VQEKGKRSFECELDYFVALAAPGESARDETLVAVLDPMLLRA
jgi:hypothetical protein